MFDAKKLMNNMIEVTVESDDKFHIVMETLTRMGVGINKSHTLYQSCHIVNLNKKIYLAHYKELLSLEQQREIKIDDTEMSRRNTIATLLEIWGMVKIVNKEIIDEFGTLPSVFIVKYENKDKWNLKNTFRQMDFGRIKETCYKAIQSQEPVSEPTAIASSPTIV